MKKSFISGFATLLLGLGVCSVITACGDDSSSAEEEIVSDILKLDGAFDILLDKADYKYDSKDSSFKLIKPVCKVSKVGNLVGPKDAAEWDTLSYTAYVNKESITLKSKDSTQKFSIKESTFPVGFWAYPTEAKKKIQKGFAVGEGQMNTIFRYTGSCFMEDFLGQYFSKGNPALQEANDVLTSFYRKFLSSENADEKKDDFIIHSFTTCDEMKLFDDALVTIKLSQFRASSGKLIVSYDSLSCPVDFTLRYAYDQADCQAAYEDFKDDRKADKEFDFNKYRRDVNYNEYCIARLILNLKEMKEIPLKAAAEVNSAEFAKALVDLVVEGLNP